jgi:hypothetical protein
VTKTMGQRKPQSGNCTGRLAQKVAIACLGPRAARPLSLRERTSGRASRPRSQHELRFLCKARDARQREVPAPSSTADEPSERARAAAIRRALAAAFAFHASQVRVPRRAPERRALAAIRPRRTRCPPQPPGTISKPRSSCFGPARSGPDRLCPEVCSLQAAPPGSAGGSPAARLIATVELEA